MAENSTVLERVQELSWALFDAQITDDEMALLDNLLLSDDQARRRYVECAQLHSDLIAHFAKPTGEQAPQGSSKSPVLGFLNSGTPPLGLELPSPDDVNS